MSGTLVAQLAPPRRFRYSMRNRIFLGFSFTGMLLSLILGALCMDGQATAWQYRSLTVHSTHGILFLQYKPAGSNHKEDWQPSGWPRLNFGPDGRSSLLLPVWMPTLVFGVLFCICFAHLQNLQQRQMLGRCLQCGYCLFGLAEDRCPECNTLVTP